MDLSDHYKRFFSTLQSERRLDRVLLRIADIEENSERVNFLDSLLAPMGVFEQIRLDYPLREEKCNEKSAELRAEGNAEFSNKEFFEALCLYNESICHAEIDSEHIALGYANRSAVYFELKLYRESLENIALARQAKYPMRLMHKLDERETKCLELQNFQPLDDQPYDLKLSCKPHKQFHNIAECIFLDKSNPEDWQLRTNRALQVGQIVAIEKPFCSVLAKSTEYQRCTHCKQQKYLTLIPCKQCCSVMFCSEECRSIALASYHKYECPIIDALQKCLLEDMVFLRVCLTAIGQFPKIKELMAFCADPDNKNKCAFDLDYNNLTDRQYYRAINGLKTKQHLRNGSTILEYSFICSVMKHFLLKYTPLQNYVGTGKAEQKFFSEMLMLQYQKCASNSGPAGGYVNGSAAIQPLLKHSCAPNIMLIFGDNKTYFVVERPIPKNGQLTSNYDPHFAVFPLFIRKGLLQTVYAIDCQCEACVQEYTYPVYDLLPQKQHVPSVMDINEISDIPAFQSWNYVSALSLYRKYCDFLQRYAEEYPCRQLFEAGQIVFLSLYILVNAIPLGQKISLILSPKNI